MNNRGVSAVIGVMLMVAITVAFAGTVYVYVSQLRTEYDYITNKFNIDLNNETFYFFEINNVNIIQVNETIFNSYEIHNIFYGV